MTYLISPQLLCACLIYAYLFNSLPSSPEAMNSPFNSESQFTMDIKPVPESAMETESFPGSAVTDEQLQRAATLFRDNYGIWGKQARRPGQRVALSPNRMREQYFPQGANTSLITVKVDETLAGHAFACRWRHKGLTVCWITQLVVGKEFRQNGCATAMLNHLRQHTDNIYGIMSSHPAACLAAAKVFGGTVFIEQIPLEFIASNAAAILEASPVQYIRDAATNLHGTLFENDSAMVSGVDTGFLVDHDEPNAALNVIKDNLHWPLGELIEGHEFLLIIQHRRSSERLGKPQAT